MPKTLDQRASGVLLHLSSLPGPAGNGDLGPRAHAFIGFLAQAGQSWWQMLPTSPPGAAFSPYQSISAFAGNPLFISLERLAEDGWLDAADLAPDSHGHPADFQASEDARLPLLRRAWLLFREAAAPADKAAYTDYCAQQRDWLDDYALFVALKQAHQGRGWTEWEAGFRDHQLPALEQAREAHALEVDFQKFLQYQFARQWQQLRAAAHERGIGLIGDLPIFVSHDSADVWAHRELFELDATGKPSAVAGVPPDYFSADGQRWGNPLYRWDLHKATAYQWWVARFWRLLQQFDAVRVDHFIGFHRGWAIPEDAPTAKDGAYRPGPGAEFFELLRAQLGGLPIIAEDLGVVTEEVVKLRKDFGMPGMRVLQFSFGGEADQLPSAYEEDVVAYTGTHDNNTTLGWLQDPAAPAEEKARALAWIDPPAGARPGKVHAALSPEEQVWGLIEAAWDGNPRLAIVPAQDLLALPAAYRMNTPGTVEHNWQFRLEPGALTAELAQRLRTLTEKHNRL
jgi:4-alpha-glucanotransferase